MCLTASQTLSELTLRPVFQNRPPLAFFGKHSIFGLPLNLRPQKAAFFLRCLRHSVGSSRWMRCYVLDEEGEISREMKALVSTWLFSWCRSNKETVHSERSDQSHAPWRFFFVPWWKTGASVWKRRVVAPFGLCQGFRFLIRVSERWKVYLYHGEIYDPSRRSWVRFFLYPGIH